MDEQTRRRFLASGAAATIGTVGLAGCLGGGTGSVGSGGAGNTASNNSTGGDSAPNQLTVGYVPIYPNMQHFIMQKEGYYDSLPAEVTVQRFPSGPTVVKALAGGAVDSALFGITPSMVLIAKGTNASVLAANSRNGFRFMATNAFADLYAKKRADAFSAYERQHGRQLAVAVPPAGSVPDIILRYWITRDLGLGELNSVINRQTLAPAKVPRAIQAGEIDATMIQEPYATVIERAQGFSGVVWSGNILTGHPVTVLFVRNSVSKNVAKHLVEQHIKATRFVHENPKKAAKDAAAVIGSGLSTELARAAMESWASDFLSNPHEVSKEAATMAQFVEKVGKTKSVVSPEELFDYSVYDAVSNQ